MGGTGEQVVEQVVDRSLGSSSHIFETVTMVWPGKTVAGVCVRGSVLVGRLA